MLGFAFIRSVPGQQFFHCLSVRQIDGICMLQKPGQVAVWIQFVLHRGLDQAEDHRASCGSLRSVGKQKVLPVNHKGLNAPLRPVVAQLQPAVFQVVRQIRPLLLQIAQRAAQL